MLAEPLNAGKAVQIALLNSRRLRAVYEELGIAQAELVKAGLPKNPILDFTVRFVNGGGTIYEWALLQNFIDIFMIPLRKRFAEADF
jgi:cobalt-zinc-cadmium efflux system outer membrane protein